MGMNEIRLRRPHDLLQTGSRQSHLLEQAAAFGTRRAMKKPAIDLFLQDCPGPLFGRRQMLRLPAQRALLTQDGQGTKTVAAVQRQRMVKHVQNTEAHRGACAAETTATGSVDGTSRTLRRKASNIRTVHKGEL